MVGIVKTFSNRVHPQQALTAMPIHSTISCNLDQDILQAAWPLLQDEKIAALEWSFDALYQEENIPAWFLELIQTYSDAGRLVGHGIFFSLFSGMWHDGQQQWLAELKKQCSQFNFDHITEHFGFMTGANFHKGAPISIPYNRSTVALGRDRLTRIYDASECPVGLENLAFAYSIEEIKRHGEFLHELIQPINGFIILDLHNLYCQLHNFNVDFSDIINLYPLDRVREIHISGGSWQDSNVQPQRTIRRDTHDDAVPAEVFNLLEQTIPLCPQLKFIVLEQLGQSLSSEQSKEQFRIDFLRMDDIVQSHQQLHNHILPNNFIPKSTNRASAPLEDKKLHKQQIVLSNILEQSATLKEAKAALEQSILANSDWKIEQWNPYMLETVMMIAQKWK